MKKLLLTTICFLTIFLSAHAQEEKKAWIGGTFGLNYSKVSSSDNTINLTIAPEIGFVLSDKISLGLNLGVIYAEDRELINGLDPVERGTIFLIGGFTRFHLYKMDRVDIFLDGGLNFGFGKGDFSFADEESIKMIEVGFRPGISYALNEQIRFVSRLGFLGYGHTKIGYFKQNSFGLSTNLSQVELGVNIFF